METHPNNMTVGPLEKKTSTEWATFSRPPPVVLPWILFSNGHQLDVVSATVR